MCRWFAFISHKPVLLEDVLIDPKHAITRQIHDHYLPGLVAHHPSEAPGEYAAVEKEVAMRNNMFSIDGFGVAWYTTARAQFEPEITQGPRPALYKTVAPALTDPTFTYICGNTGSNCIFAHVRAASAPPIVETNNHPFVFGRHSFMHNGSVANFSKIRREFAAKISHENFALIQGNTDSEHIAALYFTHLGDTSRSHSVEKMRDALALTIRDVQDIQAKLLAPKELENSANSLNLCTTDGEQMVAVRYRNHSVQQPPSLYVSTTAGVALNRKYTKETAGVGSPHTVTKCIGSARDLVQEHTAHGPHVIVASEPTTFNEKAWKLLDKGDYIMVDRDMNIQVDTLEV